MEKYGGISLYDIYLKKIYEIDHADILFVKKYGDASIDNTDNPDVT